MPLPTPLTKEAAFQNVQRSGPLEPTTTAQDVALRKKKQPPITLDDALSGTHCVSAYGDCTNLASLQPEAN
jgi:hypothetical protein